MATTQAKGKKKSPTKTASSSSKAKAVAKPKVAPRAKKKVAASKAAPSEPKVSRSEPKAKPNPAGATEVLVDRRTALDGRRPLVDRRAKQDSVESEARKAERRAKVPRRRQIDPTTCERDYSDEEIEFMRSLDEYKRANGRMFPTCSEILEVIRKLGYRRMPMGSELLAAPEASLEGGDASDAANDSIPLSAFSTSDGGEFLEPSSLTI